MVFSYRKRFTFNFSLSGLDKHFLTEEDGLHVSLTTGFGADDMSSDKLTLTLNTLRWAHFSRGKFITPSFGYVTDE